MAIVYFDGEFITDEDRAIPVSDRGFLFGDGVFTTVRVCQGNVEFFNAHVRRLEDNCQELGIKFPDIVFDDVAALIAHNHAEEGLWRLKIIITGGQVSQRYNEERPHGHLVMMIEPYCQPQGPASLGTCAFPIVSPLAHIKSLSYLDRFWIKRRAEYIGVDDLIVIMPGGIVLETAFSNIFWIHEDEFLMPAMTLPLLPGIALTTALGAAESLEMNVKEIEWRVKDIPKNANVFICNALTGIRPVCSIDGCSFSLDHPLSNALSREYQQLAHHSTLCSKKVK